MKRSRRPDAFDLAVGAVFLVGFLVIYLVNGW